MSPLHIHIYMGAHSRQAIENIERLNKVSGAADLNEAQRSFQSTDLPFSLSRTRCCSVYTATQFARQININMVAHSSQAIENIERLHKVSKAAVLNEAKRSFLSTDFPFSLSRLQCCSIYTATQFVRQLHINMGAHSSQAIENIERLNKVSRVANLNEAKRSF